MTRARDIANFGNGVDAADITDATITAGKLAAGAVEGAMVTPSGRRNLIINGAMQVAQRGTSQSSGGYGSLDRWNLNASSGVTVTQTSCSVSETQTLGGLEYYTRFVGTSTDTNRQWFQKIEGLQRFSGQTVTLSFYAKAAASFTLDCQYGLLGASNDTYYVWDTIEVGTSWQRYTTTVTIPDMSSGYTFGSGSNLRICFEFNEVSYTLDITGVQLEVGSVATPFEHRSYGEELALCQRYFERYDTAGQSYMKICVAAITQGSFARAAFPFTVTKRANPTMAWAGDLVVYDGNNNSVDGLTATRTTPKIAELTFTTSVSMTTNSAGIVQFHNSGDRYIHFDAEL